MPGISQAKGPYYVLLFHRGQETQWRMWFILLPKGNRFSPVKPRGPVEFPFTTLVASS